MLPVQAEKEQAESHEYAEKVALMILACVGPFIKVTFIMTS